MKIIGRNIICAVIAGLLGFVAMPVAASFVITVNPEESPSSLDLFDVTQGTIVITNSAQNPGSDARSAIGFVNNQNIDDLVTYFLDGLAPDTTDFIIFKTSEPVPVVGFNLFTYDDSYIANNFNRGMTSFKFYSSPDGNDFSLIETVTFGNSYLNTYGGWQLLVKASFPLVKAQFFRIESTRFNNTGPRIVEFDAVSGPPTIIITNATNGNSQVAYFGILQQSTNLVDWQDVVPQPASHFEISTDSSSTLFFRTRARTP